MNKAKLRQDGTPLYLQVADIMRQRILRGRWATGEFLPTIDKLVQEFEVARITVRDAVKILESEGLVEPRRGRGTMVLPHQLPTRPLSVVTSLAELVDLYRGDVPDLVSLDDTEADLPDGVTFGKAAPKYHKLRRIHSRDGQQYCVITLYIAKAVFDRHEALLRTELVLPVLFDDPNLHIETARQSLIVSKCDLETAGLLDLKVGEPMAEVRRIMCDDKGEIFYLADVVYRGDYVRLDMDLMA
ncbi:GntR family transcriptional regulator [Ruegeria arenilitoris]|uniref:GntR family transcriptional regulator n=1 Tax=Ruegeria arenilitoris TaxID=1173585 RepID=UPI00148015A1|nr:GntR family transcriptional regulator [Ruegeria arenilitoris]